MRVVQQPERDQFDLAAVLYALSDPTRLELVRRLAQDGERACGTFDVCATKATLSHHFKVLREAGLIHTRAEGVYRFISLRRRDLDARFPGLLKAVLKAAGAPGR
ncbi:transcriptional regulator [Geothrix rubra]|uniref:Transcriptional regulator n=1 Tax=Geothrix rubra TaxID=2927977 RepID=A0ABQ5QA25_9BACT|nr:helix-turn-helix domain-containing protein [Geothrix rubra]GLH71280.1 transcriptional regulator [Geothrix rubra]